MESGIDGRNRMRVSSEQHSTTKGRTKTPIGLQSSRNSMSGHVVPGTSVDRQRSDGHDIRCFACSFLRFPKPKLYPTTARCSVLTIDEASDMTRLRRSFQAAEIDGHYCEVRIFDLF